MQCYTIFNQCRKTIAENIGLQCLIAKHIDDLSTVRILRGKGCIAFIALFIAKEKLTFSTLRQRALEQPQEQPTLKKILP
jgi:hypothetical protein